MGYIVIYSRDNKRQRLSISTARDHVVVFDRKDIYCMDTDTLMDLVIQQGRKITPQEYQQLEEQSRRLIRQWWNHFKQRKENSEVITK